MKDSELRNQIEVSGVLKDNEEIIFADTGCTISQYSNKEKGALVLTKSRLLVLKKPSFFSKGFNLNSEYKTGKVKSISVSGLLSKILKIQFDTGHLLNYKCFNAEYFRYKILEERDKKPTKKEVEKKYYCQRCEKLIDEKVHRYSTIKLGKPLCMIHQGTDIQKKLFSSLKDKGIDCEYEYYDGHKHVDIAIHNAKLYVEVDGKHHSRTPQQLNADLKRQEFSSREGYSTMRYTNQELEESLDEIADALVKVAKDREK